MRIITSIVASVFMVGVAQATPIEIGPTAMHSIYDAGSPGQPGDGTADSICQLIPYGSCSHGNRGWVQRGRGGLVPVGGGTPTSGREDRSYVEFILNGINTSSISDASLNLQASRYASSSTGGRQMNVYGYAADGLSTLGDFGIGSQLLGTITMPTSSQPSRVSFDVSDFLTSLSPGPVAAGFELRYKGLGSILVAFGSGTGSAPSLMVSTASPVPAPPVLALIAIGFAGFGLSRYKVLGRKARL